MAALSLCFLLPLGPSSPDGLFLRFRGCRSAPGPSGSWLRCRGREGSALPCARLQVCCSSDSGLRFAEDCHCLHSMLLSCFSLLDCHVKRESDRPQFVFEHIHASGTQKAAARPPFISVFTHCCASHSAIVSARSNCAPHPDPFSDFGFFHSCPALRVPWLQWCHPVWRS